MKFCRCSAWTFGKKSQKGRTISNKQQSLSSYAMTGRGSTAHVSQVNASSLSKQNSKGKGGEREREGREPKINRSEKGWKGRWKREYLIKSKMWRRLAKLHGRKVSRVELTDEERCAKDWLLLTRKAASAGEKEWKTKEKCSTRMCVALDKNDKVFRG